jgi:hypothetical protein
MIAPDRRTGVGLIFWVLAASVVSGQTPSLTVVKDRVAAGDVVYVTDMSDTTIKGTLMAITADAVQVMVGTDVRRIVAADVRRVQRRQSDSVLNGVVIGAAVGAIPGIYWLFADPNECTGMCPEDYAAIAIGATAGGLIDHAITRKVTVYTAGPSNGRSKSVTIGPLVRRNRKGVQIALNF